MRRWLNFTPFDGLLLLMVLIWGANYSVVKSAIQEIPPQAFNVLRMGVASAIFLAALSPPACRASRGPTGRAWRCSAPSGTSLPGVLHGRPGEDHGVEQRAHHRLFARGRVDCLRARRARTRAARAVDRRPALGLRRLPRGRHERGVRGELARRRPLHPRGRVLLGCLYGRIAAAAGPLLAPRRDGHHDDRRHGAVRAGLSLAVRRRAVGARSRMGVDLDGAVGGARAECRPT